MILSRETEPRTLHPGLNSGRDIYRSPLNSLISKINWITHPFELNELILSQNIYNELRFSKLSNSLKIKLLGIEIRFTIK